MMQVVGENQNDESRRGVGEKALIGVGGFPAVETDGTHQEKGRYIDERDKVGVPAEPFGESIGNGNPVTEDANREKCEHESCGSVDVDSRLGRQKPHWKREEPAQNKARVDHGIGAEEES